MEGMPQMGGSKPKEEKPKLPDGFDQNTIDALQAKLPDLLLRAEKGELKYGEANSLGQSLALKDDYSTIEKLLKNGALSLNDRQQLAEGGVEVFANPGNPNPNKALMLLNYLFTQPDYQNNPQDSSNQEKMFSNKRTNLLRRVSASYIKIGQLDIARELISQMMPGVDKDAMELQLGKVA